MTAIRTKYLWKRCLNCREMKVCRHFLPEEHTPLPGEPLPWIWSVEQTYICGECDPAANPPEYAGVEHEVTFENTGPIADLLRNPNEGADLRHSRGVDFPLAEPDATGTP